MNISTITSELFTTSTSNSNIALISKELLIKIGLITTVALAALKFKNYCTNQLMIKAIELKSPLLLKLARIGGTNVNADLKSGWTPLHIASEYGDKTLIDILIQSGANINAVTCDQNTPLHIASNCGNNYGVEVLVHAGANVNAANCDQETPLYCAAKKGHTDTFISLINAGADVNAANCDQETPLCCAAKKGHTDIFISLINAGADVNAANCYQETPLYIVSLNQIVVAVNTLIQAGANVNAANCNQNTPLHIASGNSNQAIVDALIKAGADVNAANCDQETPLHIASFSRNNTVVDALIQAGADPQYQNKNLETPLRKIQNILNQDEDTLIWHLLGVPSTTLHSTAAILQKNHRNTPLHYAASSGDIDKVKELIKTKANLNARNIAGITALHLAARYGHLDIIKLLLNNGANPFVKDQDGNNDLHYSIMARKMNVNKYLIDHVTKLAKMKNKEDQTPFDLAENKLTKNLKTRFNQKVKEQETTRKVFIRKELPRPIQGMILAHLGMTNQELQSIRNGNNALHRAVLTEDKEAIQDVLKKNPKRLHEVNKYGNTPLALINNVNSYLYKPFMHHFFEEAKKSYKLA